jgi:hypothetical protein
VRPPEGFRPDRRRWWPVAVWLALALIAASVVVARAASKTGGTISITLTGSAKQNQTITFGPLPDRNYGDPPFTVSASASSGLTVTFTASGSCKASGPNGSTITLTGPGSCTVTAHQAGNGSYNPAPDVSQTFTIFSNCGSGSSNMANFNGTAIPAGRTIWFSGTFWTTPAGPKTAAPLTVNFTNAKITFTVGTKSYTIPVPNGEVVFSSAASQATTSYNSATNTWVTTTPYGLPGATFMDAVAYLVPAGGLPGNIKNVTWSMNIGTSAPAQGISVKWQWGAAVYTKFASTLGGVQVKPTDSPKGSAYQNGDAAGTPENYKAYVVGGAMGGGGSNYTGSSSGTATQKCG